MKSTAANIDWSEKYLKLLRETLTRAINMNTIDFRHASEVPSWTKPETEMDRSMIAVASFLADTVSSNSEEHWLEVRRCVKVDRCRVEDGSQLHPNAETMTGLKRLEKIEFLIRNVCEQNIPGDFVEAGVWRGGASIYARACLDKYSGEHRKNFLYDTFSGFGRIVSFRQACMKRAANGINMDYRNSFRRIAHGEQKIKREATFRSSTGPICRLA
jgi:hypothetical protein